MGAGPAAAVPLIEDLNAGCVLAEINAGVADAGRAAGTVLRPVAVAEIEGGDGGARFQIAIALDSIAFFPCAGGPEAGIKGFGQRCAFLIDALILADIFLIIAGVQQGCRRFWIAARRAGIGICVWLARKTAGVETSALFQIRADGRAIAVLTLAALQSPPFL